jgi:hypothetical protein
MVRQASMAMQRAARAFFQQGRDVEFVRAARLMEEINRFQNELDKKH